MTTISAPIVEDRADWKNPIPGLDRRTKRRALRYIRRVDAGGNNVAHAVDAPAGIDLEQFAFYWGRTQTKSLRQSGALLLLIAGEGLANGALWFLIVGLVFLLVAAVLAISMVRDIRACRRYVNVTARLESFNR